MHRHAFTATTTFHFSNAVAMRDEYKINPPNVPFYRKSNKATKLHTPASFVK